VTESSDPRSQHTGQARLDPSSAADSAGVPWEGRTLRPNPFSGDDGHADAALVDALSRVNANQSDPALHSAVVAALAGTRLYAPVLPVDVEHGTDEHGRVHDNKSDMAMVRLAAADGRQATPAFSAISALTAWSADARPVPIEAERLAVAAIDEDAQLVVLDAGTEHTFLLRRPALWAFVQQQPWQPAWADPEVAARLGQLAQQSAWIDSIGLAPGSSHVAVSGPEVLLVITPSSPPAKQQLAELQSAITADPLLVDRIDSLTITLRG